MLLVRFFAENGRIDESNWFIRFHTLYLQIDDSTNIAEIAAFGYSTMYMTGRNDATGMYKIIL
jgi:hypothetical protein